MREKTYADAMTGLEVWVLVLFFVYIFFTMLPLYLSPFASFVTLMIAQYLWRKGYFKADKYHSRKDEEIAKRMEASQLRLKEEERQRKEQEGLLR